MKNTKNTPLHIILDVLSTYYDCRKEDIFSRTRKRHLILRKQWFQYLARVLNPEYTLSLSEIGSYYSDVTKIKYNHAGVLSNVKKMKGFIELYSSDKELQEYFIKEINIKHVEELMLAKKTQEEIKDIVTCQPISIQVTKLMPMKRI